MINNGGNFGKFLAYSIISAVIFIIIFNIFSNPSTISKSINNVKNLIKVNAEVKMDDISTKNCLNEIKQLISNTEENSYSGNLRINIQNYKKFNKTSEVLAEGVQDNELFTHNFEMDSNGQWFYNDTIYNHSEIVLVKYRVGVNGGTGGLLNEAICVEGHITGQSKRLLSNWRQMPV